MKDLKEEKLSVRKSLLSRSSLFIRTYLKYFFDIHLIETRKTMQVQLSQSSIIIPATESSVSETLVGRKSDKILHECNKHLRSSMVGSPTFFPFSFSYAFARDTRCAR